MSNSFCNRIDVVRSAVGALICVVLSITWTQQLQAQADQATASPTERLRSDTGSNLGGINGGNAGGGAEADFDALIELILATVEPDSWEDVGGEGSIQEFPGGVFVDASGVMRRVNPQLRQTLTKRFRLSNQMRRSSGESDVFARSVLRKVSLNRLEQEIERRAAARLQPTESMRRLAGLERIDYLVIDDESGDVILAGPAGKWIRDDEGRVVSEHTRRPVLNLDDLIVLLRNVFAGPGRFSCSITPVQANLAAAKAFIDQSTQRPLQTGERKAWLDGLRDRLGNQRIEISGVPAGSRLARRIVEADYQMKLVGIGLIPGTDGVVSYLDSIEIPKGSAPPAMGVLRWWFTPSTETIYTNPERDTFVLTGHAVRVQSENEFLTDQGQRVHTGEADDLTREFADSFTRHFDALARQYPVFADLENIFELSLVAAILHGEDVPNRINWPMKHFLGPNCPIAQARQPREIASVINHRVINRKHVVAAVSGGVTVGAKAWASEHVRSSNNKLVRPVLPRSEANAGRWWWD
jgi:hypothetical protein